MSTGTIADWQGTIAEIGAAYPFAGYEPLMVILGVTFWIGWHVVNLISEGKEWEDDLEKFEGKPLPGEEYSDF